MNQTSMKLSALKPAHTWKRARSTTTIPAISEEDGSQPVAGQADLPRRRRGDQDVDAEEPEQLGGQLAERARCVGDQLGERVREWDHDRDVEHDRTDEPSDPVPQPSTPGLAARG